jgi:hypothetical protein
MCLKRKSRLAAVLAIAVMITASAGAWSHRHEQKARVRFLATSTLIRGTWGLNQDTFLAQLLLPKQNEMVLVRLVDAYPSDWPPLSRAVLQSGNGTILHVQRDQECDRPFRETLLRTAPGDPMAILPERLGYQPQLDRTPEPGTILPCCRTIR